MSLSRIGYRLGLLDPAIEIITILAWMLLFPKGMGNEFTYIYFLGMAGLLVLFSYRNIYFLKNLGLSQFTLWQGLFSLVLIVTSFFSVYVYRSIFFFVDIFLISFYFVLLFIDKNSRKHYYIYLSYLVSLFSLINTINYIFPIFPRRILFFTNTIVQGIVSGLGVLILLYYLLKKFDRLYLVLFLVNCTAVFLSHSKAAFIGTVAFSLVMIISRKKVLVLVPLVITVFTFIVPNPIKDAFIFSIKKDPYAFDRVYIWKVSLDIFLDHPWTGVGPDNFEEVSKRYNFKQTRGPANYFKVPHQSHNDYLKILAETGIPGLLIMLAVLFFTLRRVFSSSLFNINKILILYILFQALLFNILFHSFFFFLLLFLLKLLFEEKLQFNSFHIYARVFSAVLLAITLVLCYLFPLLSSFSLEHAQYATTPEEGIGNLDRASALVPMDTRPYYQKAQLHFALFEKNKDLKHFSAALENLHQVKRLNPYAVPADLMESNIYYSLLRMNIEYPALEQAIISPLERAGIYDPYNPFVKMRAAQVYLEFQDKENARLKAVEALEIEPGFISALYFLQRNFNYFGSEQKFSEKIKVARDKVKDQSLIPGTYLYELYALPGSLPNNRDND